MKNLNVRIEFVYIFMGYGKCVLEIKVVIKRSNIEKCCILQIYQFRDIESLIIKKINKIKFIVLGIK